jgi:hypothetical protein
LELRDNPKYLKFKLTKNIIIHWKKVLSKKRKSLAFLKEHIIFQIFNVLIVKESSAKMQVKHI